MIRKSNFKLNWKYAIGEVVLIFIGITMAFGLQQWENTRNEFRKSKGYLEAFQIELESNIQSIKEHIEATQTDFDNLKYYIELVNSDSAKSLKDEDLTLMIARLGPPYFESLSVAAYQDIINSGGIELINDNALRRGILRYGVYLEEYRSRVENSLESWNTVLSPYFIEHGNLAEMKINGMSFNFPKEVFYNERNAFIRNRDYTNILRTRIIMQRGIVNYIDQELEYIQRFNNQIENYLSQ